MEEIPKRKNFTEIEKQLLLSLVEEHRDTLENKCTKALFVSEKVRAWREICKDFNCSAESGKRSVKQLKTLHENLKRSIRKDVAEGNMDFMNQYSTAKKLNTSQKINFISADRNKEPILEVLQKYIDKNKEGKVLEISSGTGQHASHFALHFPKLTFQPTENEASLLDSIRAYAEDTPTKNINQPLLVNVLDDWTKWNVSNDFDYAINVNMIHVTPFSCSIGLFKNISAVLKSGGLLFTYGAYSNNGVLEPQSNRDFDKSIRQRDPDCGVRDIQDLIKISESYGIKLKEVIDMPANNKCLVWQKEEKLS